MNESLKLTSDGAAPLDEEDRGGVLLSEALNDLRAALLKLKPTGNDGFEGLLATVLGKISGRDFRLAKSGMQHGKDGATSATAANHISFECKLYNTKINDNEVLSKIVQLISSSAPPDVWVLVTTIEISTQLLDQIQSASRKNGIGTLVLDWPCASTVPPLATACAFASDETCAFLRDNITDKACVRKAESALAAIRKVDEFCARSDALVRELQDPSLGYANARAANAKWLKAAFGDRARAKGTFGQVLAPNADGPLPLQQRNALVESVQQQMTAATSPKIVAIIGGEGHGKSWLFAQSWLTLDERPILVILPATDLKPAVSDGDLTPFLISRLIQQTDENEEEMARKRWERRLKKWKNQGTEALPRFILCVDGLNQHPAFRWPCWLERAAGYVHELGGTLVVTARENYYREHIEDTVLSEVVHVQVPEWTEVELRGILADKGVDSKEIKPAVLARLRNPRILEIAFDLLDRVQVHHFNELSVERLLFEHIRVGTRDGNAAEPPAQFSKRLVRHAQAIIDREKQQQNDDRLIFDRYAQEWHTLNADLLAVTAEHFFQPLQEDSSLYTITDDGLSLALGIAIIEALKKAERNKRDVTDALDELIGPIAALDKTADAVFSGLTVSIVEDDNRCSNAIRQALVCGFLGLQNIDAQKYRAFVAVVRNATDVAMGALFVHSTTTARYAANKNWLLTALRECRITPECWKVIREHVSVWLRSYSLDPKFGVIYRLGHDSADKIEKKMADKAEALRKVMAELSRPEQAFLDETMSKCNGHDPLLLSRNAFELLAGMPLAEFAEDLAACSFSRALNSRYWETLDEYYALIRFNRRDWEETRIRLLEASAFLAQETTSSTGRWALIEILRGTSTAEDADREEGLVEALTKDREKIVGWRLIETYCATDPCDPDSTKPDNIDVTANNYAQVNIEEVSRHRSMGNVDHFVKSALTGLARFAPQVAINTQRKIARSLVERTTADLSLDVVSLTPHCAVLDFETVCKLLEIANSLSLPYEPGSRDSRRKDNWFISQYAIQIAFPHLDGDAQLDTLIRLPPHGPPLLQLTEVLKPATPEKLEHALNLAMQSGEHNRALVALLFAHTSGTDLNLHSRTLVGQFAESEHSSVRAEAMATIARLKDPNLINEIVTRGWNATLLDPKETRFEIWYGSHILIEAAKRRMIGVDEVVSQISPSLYGKAVRVLGKECHSAVAAHLTAAVAKALAIELSFSPPAIEQKTEASGHAMVPLLSLAESDETVGLEAFLKRLLETPTDFESQQRERWDAFNRFEATLTKEQARLIVEDVDFEAIDALVTTSPDWSAEWVAKLLDLDGSKLMHVQNFALRLAKSVSPHDMILAHRLFEHISGGRAFVNPVFGFSRVSLEAVCVWKSADGDALDDLRAIRLDRAASDYQLAQEVLAALLADKSNFLEDYAHRNLDKPEPVANARALMVIGFGVESPASDALLSKYTDVKGLIGKAAKSARFAYDRNRWAQHWFKKMCATNSAEEFWTLSTLFLKIVDPRFELWGTSISQTGSAFPNLESSIRNSMESRMNAWKAKREKTLFGGNVPGNIHLALD